MQHYKNNDAAFHTHLWRAKYWKDGDVMEKRVMKLEGEVSDLKTRMAVAESSIKEIKEDVSSIKDNTIWILRLIVGGLIGAIITFIVQGGFTL